MLDDWLMSVWMFIVYVFMRERDKRKWGKAGTIIFWFGSIYVYMYSQHVAAIHYHTNYTNVQGSKQFTAANPPKRHFYRCISLLQPLPPLLRILSLVTLLFHQAIIILNLALPRIPFESHIMSNMQLRAHQQMPDTHQALFTPIFKCARNLTEVGRALLSNQLVQSCQISSNHFLILSAFLWI